MATSRFTVGARGRAALLLKLEVPGVQLNAAAYVGLG